MNTRPIESHNLKAAATWNLGGDIYEEVSRGIADSIEHCTFRLAPKPGELILDVATGTGWASRRVAAYGAQVIGIDLGEDLIKTATEQARRSGLRAEYLVGDAEALPFEDGKFDGIISTCGVMFVSRAEVAASELARVCKKGGRVAFTAWTPTSTLFEMFKLMKGYVSAPPPQAPPSPFEWGRRERVKELLGQTFDLRFEEATSFFREPSGMRVWEIFSKGYGPTKSLAQSLSSERLESFRNDFIAFHEKYKTELGICVPRDYLLTVGVRK